MQVAADPAPVLLAGQDQLLARLLELARPAGCCAPRWRPAGRRRRAATWSRRESIDAQPAVGQRRAPDPLAAVADRGPQRVDARLGPVGRREPLARRCPSTSTRTNDDAGRPRRPPPRAPAAAPRSRTSPRAARRGRRPPRTAHPAGRGRAAAPARSARRAAGRRSRPPGAARSASPAAARGGRRAGVDPGDDGQVEQHDHRHGDAAVDERAADEGVDVAGLRVGRCRSRPRHWSPRARATSAVNPTGPLMSSSMTPPASRQTRAAQSSQRSWVRSTPVERGVAGEQDAAASGIASRVSTWATRIDGDGQRSRTEVGRTAGSSRTPSPGAVPS